MKKNLKRKYQGIGCAGDLRMKVFEISYLLAEILDIYQYSFKQTVNNTSHK